MLPALLILLLFCGGVEAQTRSLATEPHPFERLSPAPVAELPDSRTGRFLASGERGSHLSSDFLDRSGAGFAERHAFLSSAILPGSGQWLLGQRRWLGYLAMEGWSWFEYGRRRGEGRSLQRQYRDLAWVTARRAVFDGPRVDGGFEYYEALGIYLASGAYDRLPGSVEIHPETDPATFNGRIWLLARGIFLPGGQEVPDVESEEYTLALEYYLRRAYPPEMGWSWMGNEAEQDAFNGLIRESDRAMGRATTMIGLILGNHLLSSIDALVSSRIESATEERLQFRLGIVPFDRQASSRGYYAGWTVSIALYHW